MTTPKSEWRQINDELTGAEFDSWWTNPLSTRWLLSTSKEPHIDWKKELRSVATPLTESLLEYCDHTLLKHRLHSSASWPEVTEKTASQLYQLALMHRALGSYPKGTVVEIGGGFGNFARLSLEVSDSVDRWLMIDLGAMIEIQRGFLRATTSADSFERVTFRDAESICAEDVPDHDLAIAAFSVTEMPDEAIKFCCESVFAKSPQAWILGQWRFADGSETLRSLLSSLLSTHDCSWRPFIYSAADDWPVAEIHAVAKTQPGSGRLTRLPDLPIA